MSWAVGNKRPRNQGRQSQCTASNMVHENPGDFQERFWLFMNIITPEVLIRGRYLDASPWSRLLECLCWWQDRLLLVPSSSHPLSSGSSSSSMTIALAWPFPTLLFLAHFFAGILRQCLQDTSCLIYFPNMDKTMSHSIDKESAKSLQTAKQRINSLWRSTEKSTCWSSCRLRQISDALAIASNMDWL